MTNKTLDDIIDLFCIVGDSISDDNSVWGMDTEIFKTRQEAREALLDIFYQNGVDCNEN
jgi:hypothetical protein